MTKLHNGSHLYHTQLLKYVNAALVYLVETQVVLCDLT